MNKEKKGKKLQQGLPHGVPGSSKSDFTGALMIPSRTMRSWIKSLSNKRPWFVTSSAVRFSFSVCLSGTNRITF